MRVLRTPKPLEYSHKIEFDCCFRAAKYSRYLLLNDEGKICVIFAGSLHPKDRKNVSMIALDKCPFCGKEIEYGMSQIKAVQNGGGGGGGDVTDWKQGDVGYAVRHYTGNWVKVRIRPAIVWRGSTWPYHLCNGLGCDNRINHRELHGGSNYLRFCLKCCKRSKDALDLPGV